jgi:hypothetical protein
MASSLFLFPSDLLSRSLRFCASVLFLSNGISVALVEIPPDTAQLESRRIVKRSDHFGTTHELQSEANRDILITRLPFLAIRDVQYPLTEVKADHDTMGPGPGNLGRLRPDEARLLWSGKSAWFVAGELLSGV